MTGGLPAVEGIPSLVPYVVGDASRREISGGLRLVLEGASAARYSDSQLDDFHGRAREAYIWKPPLRLSLRARFSHDQATLRGTAGFGWWNAPFEGDRVREPVVGPRALWYFYGSPPCRLAMTPGWSGNGWFAQGMDVPEIPGWIVRLGMLAMRLPAVRRAAQRAAGTASRAAENPLHDIDITQTHEYVIEWLEGEAIWSIDGQRVLHQRPAPRGPLALVLWMDNQWATLDGEWGLLQPPQEQWLELEGLAITPL